MKVGVFDSGLGGLSILRSIRERLPQYDYVYLGDNARAPYGARSFEAIFRFTREAVALLFKQDCHLIVIACNTASAKALRSIQQKVLPSTHPDRRVLGVIRPSVEVLGRSSRTKTVGLWATEGTVRSQSFEIELAKIDPQIRLIPVACPMLVPLVEAGEVTGTGAEHFVEKYWRLTADRSESIDALLLGCTHYPLLFPLIRACVPPPVRILLQGEIVAPSLADYLARHPEHEQRLSRGATVRFLTTDHGEDFDRLAHAFLGQPVRSETIEL